MSHKISLELFPKPFGGEKENQSANIKKKNQIHKNMQQNRSSTNKIQKKWDQIHRSQTDTYEVHWTKARTPDTSKYITKYVEQTK